MDCTKTTARRGEKQLSLWIGAPYVRDYFLNLFLSLSQAFDIIYILWLFQILDNWQYMVTTQ